MALAFGTFHELSHQLRFLLFEIGIGVSNSTIDYSITVAHRAILNSLQSAVVAEGLLSHRIASHHIHDYIDQLQMQLKKTTLESRFYQWEKIRDELDESIANRALAQTYKRYWNMQIKKEAGDHPSLWSWLNQKKPQDAFLFLQQWAFSEDPSHLLAMAKNGFSRREVIQNSPEFQAQINIHWCALHKNYALSTIEHDQFIDFICHHFPHELKLWQEKLKLHHLDSEDYYPMPVHPWQWRNQIQKNYAQLIDNKSLLLLPNHQLCKPIGLHHTLLPTSNSSVVMQLPLSLQHLDTAIPCEPKPSENLDLLHFLLRKNNHYNETLFVTSSFAEIELKNNYGLKDTPHDFSAKFLQSPLLMSDKHMIPLMALSHISPFTNKPLLVEIINASGTHPHLYFQKYCYKILNSQIDLFLKYGLVLKTNSQDSFLFFEQEMIQGLILRPTTLFKIDSSYEINEKYKQWILTFIDNNLQNNIGFLIKIIGAEYQIAAHELWDIVRGIISTVLEALKDEVNPIALHQFKSVLFEHAWRSPSPVLKRLRNHREETYHDEVNPLKQ